MWGEFAALICGCMHHNAAKQDVCIRNMASFGKTKCPSLGQCFVELVVIHQSALFCRVWMRHKMLTESVLCQIEWIGRTRRNPIMERRISTEAMATGIPIARG